MREVEDDLVGVEQKESFEAEEKEEEPSEEAEASFGALPQESSPSDHYVVAIEEEKKKNNRTAPPRKKKPVPAAGACGEVNEPIPAMTRREKLKEKVTCEGCNKTITRHAQRYTHKCPAPEPAVEDIEEAPPPPPQLSRAPLRRPPQETTPGEDFMERLRVASLAYQQLERQKRSNLIRNFYGY